MTTHVQSEEEYYIAAVIEHIPPAQVLRSQVAMDRRSHIAERMEHGQSIDDVVRQLGDPVRLAESYLGAVPLVAATFWERAQAKLIDIVVILVASVAIGFVAAAILATAVDEQAAMFAVPLTIGVGVFGFSAYTIVAEYRSGQTLGKRLLGLQAVRESGTRISVGQAVVRQLPLFLQIFWIDVFFALFTDKSQRAFELISKTRVVCVPQDQSA